jgi:hypothetical protein
MQAPQRLSQEKHLIAGLKPNLGGGRVFAAAGAIEL